MTNAANPTNTYGDSKYAKLYDRFSDFLLKTRKRNLALTLQGNDDLSDDIVGEDFAKFEQDLTNGLELTHHDQLRIQARIQRILRSSRECNKPI
ncbi:hypothetical protein ROA7450_00549 [Roseovarius albus]|uniref:Uncharacterized protein n=1 Tax=Roseovarius albus TaxID=1247867 RepID=A0A1X6YD27_9RHOB|nr:hypothetical protein [Roseovarius albus]SLN17771.1 hypothetical protein ROA7450_00549 [Roseovarius albus]